MPASIPLLCLLLLVSAISNVLARMVLAGDDVALALTGSLLALVAWAMVIAGLLRFKGLSERFGQAFSSLLAIDIVMTWVSAMPLLLARGLDGSSALAGVIEALFMLFFVWDMLAKGAVYRQALNIGPTLGNLLALCMSFGFIYLDSLLAPATTVAQLSQ